MKIRGRHFENGEPVIVTVENERIVGVTPFHPDGDARELPLVAPGFFDLQINGHGGRWFSSETLTVDDVLEILNAQFGYGVTRICPTLITNSFEALSHGFATINEACQRETWAAKMVVGCHLEGPYISAEDGPRGAHPIEHVRQPDWTEFSKLQKRSGNRIRIVTLAPELNAAIDFIHKACDEGIVVAIGHTAASSDDIAAAVEAGAKLSTHLGNGAHPVLPRHPNYIWDQLANPRLYASLITDGFHLPVSVMESFVRAKPSGRMIVTCDASGLAGCPPGRYGEGGIDVEILQDGRIVIAGQQALLAGSALHTHDCIARLIRSTSASLVEAIYMVTKNPSRLLRSEDIRLRRGSRADLTVFRHDAKRGEFAIDRTIAAGVLRFDCR